jgi:HSP20 family protein
MLRFVKYNREPALSNLVNQFFENEFAPLANRVNPATNIKENEDAFELEIQVPGYTKDEVHVELEDKILSISAEIENENEEISWKREFVKSSFSRSFKLPDNANGEKIKAEQKDGILHIMIPKVKEEPKLKKLIAIA